MRALVILMLSLPMASAKADKKKSPAQTPPPAETAPVDPGPGKCANLQPGVKICKTPLEGDGKGVVDVYTYAGGAVRVEFQDEVLDCTPPPPDYFQFQKKGRSVTLAAVAPGFPEPTTVICSTEGDLTVTLNLRTGSRRDSDTQVIIRDPRRNARQAELGRRAEAELAPLRRALEEDRRKLEQTAQARASEIIREEIARAGFDIASTDTDPARSPNGVNVLRAERILRVGARRFLIITVENLDRDVYEVKNVRLFSRSGGAEVELRPLEWEFATTSIPAGEDPVRGVVELPAKPAQLGKARFKVVVEEKDPRRTVQVAGIQVR